ncbi:type II secretion system F family protein [Nocardioides sp.]|uniref:type II secretion system F family protein n=1 Tax=Nocardioides sp. TaxID=35761 RepID=UPI00286B0110|nr:type II secretion system F family protein [Nocardioides sp.]
MPRRSSRLRTLLPTTLVAGLLVLLPATAARAADGTIAHAEPTSSGLQVLVSVPADVDVDLADVTVTVDGTSADAEAAPAASATQVRRTAVLAIDTSNSMKGDRFVSAKAAALAYLDTVPDDVYVGIVSFAAEVTSSLAPTQDRAAAVAVVEALELTQQTRLYDGVLGAVAMAGTEGQRSLLVLSDGADTSTTPLNSVTRSISDAEILVDVVSLGQRGDAVAALEELAAAGEGQVIAATPEALQETFSQEADVLARQVLVTVQVPSSVTATQAQVEITLGTSTGPVVAAAFTTVQAEITTAGPTSSSDGGWNPGAWVKYAGIVVFALGLALLLLLLVPRRSRPLSVEERVSLYTARPGDTPATKPESEQPLTQAKEAAAEVLRRNKGLEDRISLRLDAAGSELKASEWLLVHAAIFVTTGLVGLLLGRGSLLLGVFFLFLGALGPWVYLGLRKSRRRKAFNSQLPDTLQLMSGSLSAGLSLAQSVDTIVREGNEPVSTEFKRVLVETRLGVSLEDALEGVAERFESKDFAWVVMAIKIQRQVGGNLAELLNTVAATMREREYMRRQVAALSAEGKLSAYVLGGLPPLFLLYLLVAQRDYVIVLFTDPRGWLMLALAGALLGLGAFWMSKLVKVEV